jgi:hypothetical protein
MGTSGERTRALLSRVPWVKAVELDADAHGSDEEP